VHGKIPDQESGTTAKKGRPSVTRGTSRSISALGETRSKVQNFPRPAVRRHKRRPFQERQRTPPPLTGPTFR